jgi:hypothetical protein
MPGYRLFLKMCASLLLIGIPVAGFFPSEGFKPVAALANPVVTFTPAPYIYAISTTSPSTGSATCGPYSVPSPAASLYCTSIQYAGTTTTCPGVAPTRLFIGGNQAPVPSSSMYWADAGLGGQFLRVSWDTGYIYITALAPSAPFAFVLNC